MRQTKITFTKEERRDLLKSWLVVSIAVAIIYTPLKPFDVIALLIATFAAAITAGIGFLLHELAHKIVAIHYGCSAEFKSHNTMLGLGLLLAVVLKVLLLAPGAVYVKGAQSKRENGLISAAGPTTNVLLGMIFLLGYILSPQSMPLLQALCEFGLIINAWLAVFNMIPFPPFDGYKIWRWNKIIHIAITLFGAALLVAHAYL